jgi:hypothetical protein
MMTTEMAMEHKPNVVANSGENFILKVSDTHFFLTFGDNRADVRGTRVLSEAAHMKYLDADVLCQTLRVQGYDAAVCDRYGLSVTVETLKEKDEPVLPMSLAEYNSTPVPILKRRYYSEPKYKQRLDAAIEQGIVKLECL